MNKELYVVEHESTHYAQPHEYCLVWATSEEDAKAEAEDFVNELWYERDSEQFLEENDDEDDGECYGSIGEVYLLSSEDADDIREYVNDPTQAEFYPIVNSQ